MSGEFVISLPLFLFFMRLQLRIARNEHWTAGIREVHRRPRPALEDIPLRQRRESPPGTGELEEGPRWWRAGVDAVRQIDAIFAPKGVVPPNLPLSSKRTFRFCGISRFE
jgi:hypothetical protein